MKKHHNETLNETTYTQVLENGMTVVILHKDKNINTSAYLAFPYGSLNIHQQDDNGNSFDSHPGLAHFLEHKLFENHNGMDVMERFTELSCNVNAFTSYNETVYYFSTARQDLEEPLNLLLDFVQELAITDASVEKEKDIIIQELRMYHQMPESRLMYETFQSLYAQHPVRFDIGGSEDSVRSINKNDLESAYHLNYHPSKALMVIVTSADPASVIEMVKVNQSKKMFGPALALKDRVIAEPHTVVTTRKVVPMDIQASKIAYAFKLQPKPMSNLERITLEWELKIALELLFSSLNPDYENWIRSGLIHDYFGYDVEINDSYWYAMFYGETEEFDGFKALIDRVLESDMSKLLPYLKQLKRRYLSYTYRVLDDQDDYAVHYLRSAFVHLTLEDTIRIIENLSAEAILKSLEHLKTPHRSVVIVEKSQTGQTDQ